MAFKFKTKKRPTAAQAFAGGFAQGAIKGLQEGAERSLQDRLNQQEAFKEFRKDFSQSINYIDVSDEDRKILRDAQSMMLMGTLKNKDEVVTHLNAKSPNLGFKITGASAPQVIGGVTGGYSTLQFIDGKPVVKQITDPVESPFSNQILLTKTSPTGEVTKQLVDKSLLKDPVVTKEEQLSKTKKAKTVEEKQLELAQKEVIKNATEEGISIVGYMEKYDGQPEVELLKQLQKQEQEVVPESTSVQPATMGQEGLTIVNPTTGERLILKDGQWQPIK